MRFNMIILNAIFFISFFLNMYTGVQIMRSASSEYTYITATKKKNLEYMFKYMYISLSIYMIQ